MEDYTSKAAALLVSKPSASSPELLSKWWSDWITLGDMASNSSPAPPPTSGKDLLKAEAPPPPTHWDGWWKSALTTSASSPTNASSSSPSTPLKVTVWGGGAFGTAMAMCASRNGHNVVMYVRDPIQAASINEKHVNSKYLSQFTLPPNITATTDLETANSGSALFIHALPCQLTPKWLASNKHLIPEDVCICSTAKGLYVETRQLLGDAMLGALERPQPLAFLSGPSFAAEIMKGDPTAVVVASQKLYHATAVQKFLSNQAMRVYVR